MPVRLVLTSQPHNDGHSASFIVSEDFDEVFEKLYPTRPASSALEDRQRSQYTLTDGRRLACPPMSIAYAEENPQED